MSETAEDRVRRICPRAELQELKLAGDSGLRWHVLDPYRTELGRGDSPPAAWEGAEQHLNSTRYYLDDKGMPLRLAANDPDSGSSYTRITAAQYYTARAERAGR